MAKNTHIINLLPNKGDRVINQFFVWVFAIGRLLIILTETLALTVFIYRFSLDMRISDLHDQMKQSSIIIQNFKPAEDKFRNLQSRLALSKKYSESNKDTLALTNRILALGQGNITFSNITITQKNVTISAKASSANKLSQFVSALKNDPDLTSISITKVEDKTTTAQTAVTLTAKRKEASL